MSKIVFALAFAIVILSVECNLEGDSLHALKSSLADPYNVLESWDPTFVNPCPWLHVTCDSQNRVTRLDLENVGLSGNLVPQLGNLSYLRYLQLSGNNISGSIPSELGNLANLMYLDLSDNQLTGHIPPSLANLTSLQFLLLNDNKLTGTIPNELIQLAQKGNIEMNVSDNNLTDAVPPPHADKNSSATKSYMLFVLIFICLSVFFH